MAEKDDGGFVMAADGWAQVCPLGEFLHAGAGVTQVVDAEACAAMAADFASRAAEANFPGALVDFDHFSMDAGKPSEAAGWITALEAREDGLWAKVRWTDAGLAAVTGGRYRLVSPVFPEPSACEDLGGGRIRPRRLVSVALTNEPNIRGGKPIANRAPGGADAVKENHEEHEEHEAGSGETLANRGGVKRYRWTLGAESEGGHCPTCVERSGQVKTAREWALMPPTLCGKNCRCTLEAAGDGEIENRWSDEARAASLAVRRAKAAARAAGSVTGESAGAGSDSGGKPAAGAGTGSASETPKKRTAEAETRAPAVTKGDLEGSVKARYTRLLADLDAAEGDPQKLREASKHYLEGRYKDATDFSLVDIEAVRECLKRDKTLTDYQLRAAEDALAEARAWVRGDSRGLLDAAEEEIAAKLTAAGIRFAEVEALRRVMNPVRYYAEYGVDAYPSGLPDWIDDFAAHQDIQERFPFLRDGAKLETRRFGPTAQDKVMLKRGLMTRKELTESLKGRAEAAARHDAYLPLIRKTRAGRYVRGPVKVEAEHVMHDLPPHLRQGTIGRSGRAMRLPVETAAKNITVKPTRGTGVGAGSVAAALLPLAIDALVHNVPAARRTEARNRLLQASEAGKLPERPGVRAFIGTGARLLFGDIEGAVRGARFKDPIGAHEGEEEMAKRYGRPARGTENRGKAGECRMLNAECRILNGAGAGDGVRNRWSDAAREASLAVRRAKAAARKEGAVGSGSDSGGQTAGVGAGRRVTMKRGMPEILPPPRPRGMPFIYPVPPKAEGTPAPGGRMPEGFTPPAGPATQALVEWVNVKTGERWTAPSGGYTPPNGDWVPAAGGTARPIGMPGPPWAIRPPVVGVPPHPGRLPGPVNPPPRPPLRRGVEK